MDLDFSTKDIGKFVKLADGRVAKIFTVIREAGQLHSIYGHVLNVEDIIAWDALGHSDNAEQNITEILDK